LIIIGYLGVIVLVNPTSYVIDIAIITSLVANLIASIAIITAKILSRTDDTKTIMLYSAMGLLFYLEFFMIIQLGI
jgi:hypothetical protein